MTSHVNPNTVANPLSNMYRTGSMLACINGVANVATAEALSGDFLVLTDAISLDARIHRLMSYAGNKAGSADAAFVFVEELESTVVDGNKVRQFAQVGTFELIETFDFTSATTVTEDLLAKNTGLDRTKSIKELLGLTDTTKSVALAIKLGANATADATINLDIMVERATTA